MKIGLILGVGIFFGITLSSFAAICEDFSTDPVASNRFVQATSGTESSFTYQSSNGNLLAVLDVDANDAFYRSPAFPAFNSSNDFSFSFNFRVVAIDDRVIPSVFIGLITSQHVADGGEGLVMSLSSTNGLPVVSADVEQSNGNSGGETILLSLLTDYLAIGTYNASNRQFTIEVFSGSNFVSSVGRSTAFATNSADFSVDRIGIQNDGARSFDQSVGSITIVTDNLCQPARPPVFLSVTNSNVVEGNSGSTNVVFTFRLSSPLQQTVSVDFATADISATANQDYQPTNGTLIIPPGLLSTSIVVQVFTDRTAEPDETFKLLLNNPVNAILLATQAMCTITNDDICLVAVDDVSVTEPTSGNTVVTFTISLAVSNSQSVSLRYVTADNTATAGNDYIATNRLLIFAPGVVTLTARVTVLSDAVDEANETFFLNLTNITNALCGDCQGVATITNVNPPVMVFLDDFINVQEGNSGTTNAIIGVHLSGPSGRPVTVRLATSSESATNGTNFPDYLGTNGLATISQGQTDTNFIVPVFGDAKFEPTESFSVSIVAVTNAILGFPASEEVFILNDDERPFISVFDTSVVEGNSGTTNAVFHVRLSNPSDETVTVNYSTADGMALAGSDYIATNGTLSFTNGITNLTVLVPVRGDVTNEADEAFSLVLSSPDNGMLAVSQAICIISNDDRVSICITNTEVFEGNSGTTDASFQILLSAPSFQPITLRYFTTNGSALPGIDYVATNALMTIPAGTPSATITVKVIGDANDESDEMFSVTLTNVTNAIVACPTATCTIHDDDPPCIRTADVGVLEGDSGMTNLVFTLTLSSTSSDLVEVNYYTSDGTAATADSDYIETIGNATFQPNTLSTTIVVPVLGDTNLEAHEYFYLNLTNSRNATLCNGQVRGWITNDDQPPICTPGDFIIREGSCTNLTINLPYTNSLPISIKYCLSAAPADLHSSCGSNCCTIVIQPGMLSTNFQLCVDNNTNDEPDRIFFVDFTLPGDGRFAPGCPARARGTIKDNDPPRLSGSGASVGDGGDGETNYLCVPVWLSNPDENQVSVDFFLVDGSAMGGVDFVITNGMLVFPPGVVTQLLCIGIIGDSIYEGNETFSVCFTNAINAILTTNCVTITITNNDPPPGITINDTNVVEGDFGTNFAIFTVSLTSATAFDTFVNFATIPGNATSGLDYISTNGTLRFVPTNRILTISVPIRGDTIDELDETFMMRLSNATNATIVRTNGTCIIVDDDPPEVNVTGSSVMEGNTGMTGLVFTVTLSSTSPVPVAIEFLTKDGSARANGNDYLPTNNVLTFAAGERTQFLVVTILGDTINEANETVLLCLTNAVNATIGTNQAIGTILNDDQPCLSITDMRVQEPLSGTVTGTFAVWLSGPSAIDVSVNYATTNYGITNLTAMAGPDYVGQSGTLVFSSGVTTQFINIIINADGDVESNETFAVTLFNPANILLCSTQAVGTIVDSTIPPVLTVSNAMVVEGNLGITSMVFGATLSQPTTTRIVSVDYVTIDGAAFGGVDYLATTNTLRFLPGVTTTNFTVPVIGDCIQETNETFYVRLTNVQFAALATNLVTATILDDDSAPTLFITNATIRELDSGTNNAVFNLSLSCKSSFTACVDYVTINDTATSGADYLFTMGTICFPPGVTNAQILVPVTGDFECESNETFLVQLSNPRSVQLSTNLAVGTILDDDCITAQIAPLMVTNNEGSSMRFTIVLSKPPSSPRSVNVKTVDNSAISGLDYVGTNVLVTFLAGVTNQSVDVRTLSDTEDETSETFFVMLYNSTNVVVDPVMGVGTILDGTPPCILVDKPLVIDDGSQRLIATFTISLSSTSSLPICFSYATSNGTAITPQDYGFKSGALCFLPGVSTQSVSIDVKGNTRDETNEYFYLFLFNPTNATICNPGICTIVVRPNAFCPVVTVTLPSPERCLTTPTNLTLSADAYDADGFISQVEFFANSNKIGEVRSTVATNQFRASITWFNVPVGEYDLTAVAQDNLLCKSNSPSVHLSVSLPAVVSVSGRSQFEGNAGLSPMLFDVSLASPSCKTVKVDVVTADNTARAGEDYVALATNVVFPPGITLRQVPIAIIGDTAIEPDETFFVFLTNAMNASIATNLAIGRILNDDSNCPVRIVTPLTDQTRCVCEAVTLSTTIASEIPYTVRWKADGRVISGATNTSLTLYSLKPNDAVEYIVEVSASCTSIVQKARLVLNGEGMQSPVEFVNPAPIAIADGGVSPPSIINVSCIPGVLQKVTVMLDGLSHEFVGDVDVVLVSPSRQAIKLMSDIADFDAIAVTDLKFTFTDDGAPIPCPGPIVSGTYRPTDCPSKDTDFAPPGTTLVSKLSDFTGRSPNGVWELYVADDSSRLVGNIQRGWSLQLTWNTNAPVLASARMTNNILQFNLISQGNRTHVIEGSTDLENWFPLITNVMVGTNMIISVPRLPGHNYAFYRIVRCPCISPGCFSCVARLTNPALLPDGRFQMTLNSASGKTHIIESSSDLINWARVSTNTLNAATLPVVMPRDANLDHRFYRAIRCP